MAYRKKKILNTLLINYHVKFKQFETLDIYNRTEQLGQPTGYSFFSSSSSTDLKKILSR